MDLGLKTKVEIDFGLFVCDLWVGETDETEYEVGSLSEYTLLVKR